MIDVSRQPGQVRRAVRDLQTRHWTFVSSGNVYADFSTPDRSETAPLLTPLDSDEMPDMSVYGQAKVACENAVLAADSPAAVVRSGLIGGAGDWSGRSGYWPWRFAHPTGPDVVVPDDLALPASMVDVADLASWLLHLAEQRTDGTFNATGPTTTLGEMLRVSAEVAGSSTPMRPVPPAALAQLGVSAWMGPCSLPLWIDDPTWRYFNACNTDAAVAAGLTTRPLAETFRAALDFEEQRTTPRQTGLSDDDERRIRRAVTG